MKHLRYLGFGSVVLIVATVGCGVVLGLLGLAICYPLVGISVAALGIVYFVGRSLLED